MLVGFTSNGDTYQKQNTFCWQGAGAVKGNLLSPGPVTARARSEWLLTADSVEKLTFASAEMAAPNAARTPFLSGFARLLRRRKDLGQFPEVLGSGGEEEFVICTAWSA